MARSIVILGTLDTKGDQLEYLKALIEKRGHEACVVDVGVLGPVPFTPAVSRQEVAKASGSTLEDIIALKDPHSAMAQMAKGASEIVKQLHARGNLDGMAAVGGSMGTALALAVIKVVPIRVPKLLITTVAYSAAITPDMVSGDNVMMLPWVAGLWGLNSISKGVLEMAAGAISGAAEQYDRAHVDEKQVVGVTSLGGSVTRYMNQLKPALEEKGFDVAVFHVTGMSGRMYERAIADGLINVSLDLSVGVELLNQVTGGVCTAGAQRLEAAGKKGIPQIVSPGAIEAFHWGADRPFPARYKSRPHHRHNAILLTVMSSPREMGAVGKLMAGKLNNARGPTAVVIPMKGFLTRPKKAPVPQSHTAREVAAFREALMDVSAPGLAAFRKALLKHVKPKVEVVELDAGLNDPPYVETVLRLFDEMTETTRGRSLP
jgi:uncharacterized protein (UPF0261 family)